jgi:DCN1-like protein 1/2
LTDLGVELDEVVHLALCELLQCPSIGEFDREAFISGWRSLSPNHSSSPAQSYDTIARQSAYISTLRRKLVADPSYFKQVYRNAFKLAKPENQKSVPMDSGMDFWNMFFRKGKGGIEWNSSRTKWLDMWLEFYEKNSGRPVNKDLWNMVGELVIKIKEPGGENLEWWTEDGAWPMAVDDFIASIKAKTGKEGESMDIS